MSYFISGTEIINVFNKLNEADLEYVLIRNINEELPNNLKIGKDIDILVKSEQLDRLRLFFNTNGFREYPHPHRSNIFLYGVRKFKFFKNEGEILFDLNFQLVCRSLDAGQWIPLDQMVQESAWKNKRLHVRGDFKYWTLSHEDELICLVVRSIFDKSKFEDGYKKRILELIELVDFDSVEFKMNLIFFKFTKKLLDQIRHNQFDNILDNYLSFREY